MQFGVMLYYITLREAYVTLKFFVTCERGTIRPAQGAGAEIKSGMRLCEMAA